jgi:hypothetical protein
MAGAAVDDPNQTRAPPPRHNGMKVSANVNQNNKRMPMVGPT